MRARSRTVRYLWLLVPLLLVALPFALYIGWPDQARDWMDGEQDAAPQTAPAPKSNLIPTLKTAADLSALQILDQSPPPPAILSRAIRTLGKSFDGDVGIAVQSLDRGWIAEYDGTRPYPQQSVSKLWVAMALLDKVDRGEIALGEPVTVTRADLTIFHQPIRKRIGTGSFNTDIAQLLRYAMKNSDNAANDVLFRRVGGQAGVSAFLERAGLDGIAVSTGEKDLQMAIAGMQWDDRFSFARHFWTARERVPMKRRIKAMQGYLTNPGDGAPPIILARALIMLQQGKLLSKSSSAYLLNEMLQSKTGPKRLRGGLAAGWTLAHKTGTGQVLKELATAYNDIGLLQSPSGQIYAVAVMMAATTRPVPERQAVMQAVTKAVIACAQQAETSC